MNLSDVTEHPADVAMDCLKLPRAPCYNLHKDFVAAIRSMTVSVSQSMQLTQQ